MLKAADGRVAVVCKANIARLEIFERGFPIQTETRLFSTAAAEVQPAVILDIGAHC
jgi:hypothetical protein